MFSFSFVKASFPNYEIHYVNSCHIYVAMIEVHFWQTLLLTDSDVVWECSDVIQDIPGFWYPVIALNIFITYVYYTE